jgi:hypothetical protein
MIPIKQTQLADHPDGGNCTSAVLASYFECGIDEVFDVYEHENGEWRKLLWQWFRDKGLVLIMDTITVEELKEFYGGYGAKFDKYYFVCGLTNRHPSVGHIVIYEDGKGMVHDPHPSNSGLISETEVWLVITNADELHDIEFQYIT